MICPKCKDIELAEVSSGTMYSCSKCGGLWVLNEEISRLSESSFADIEVVKEEDEDYDAKTGLCPNGHGIMIRAKADFDNPFYLERCTHCGGIWFDHGEWNQIAKNHLFENLSELWTASWQRKHQQEKNRDHYLEFNKEILGDEIFDMVISLSEKLKDHPEKMRAMGLLKNEIIP